MHEFIKTPLKDAYIIRPKVFKDSRGSFFESFNERDYAPVLKGLRLVQDNQSVSQKNVIRGLHFQIKRPQGKLVRVIKGEVLDVIVDIRKDSPTYLNSFSHILNDQNNDQFFFPPGFAHGFAVLKDNTIFQYKVTDFYNPGDEGGICYNDPHLQIDWRIKNPILSEKDKNLPLWNG